MIHTLLIAATALGAAFCYAASNVVEQRMAAAAPPETSLRVGLLWHLAHQPIWWLGILVDISGFGLQVLALSQGSLIFVQPLLVTSLLFSLVLGPLASSRRRWSSDLTWAVLMMASLATFLVAASPNGGVDQRPFRAWLPPLVVAGLAVGALVVAARRTRGAVKATCLAAAAGTSFGVSSTLMKTFASLLGRGLVPLFTAWEPYALGIVIAGGFLMLSSAFQAGDLRAALPAVEAAEPLVASVLGLTLMHETFNAHTATARALVVLAVIGMTLATVELAGSSASNRVRTDVGPDVAPGLRRRDVG